MRKLTLLLLFFSTTLLFGQNFAPVGATWYYDYDDGVGGYMLYIRSEKDTLVNTKSCKQLIERRIAEKQNLVNDQIVSRWDTLEIDTKYVYLENDTVFYWGSNSFLPLYIFNAQANDTIVLNDGSLCSDLEKIECNSFEFVVDSLSTISINGVNYRQQFTTLLDNNSNWTYHVPNLGSNYSIIEIIGSTSYFFGRSKFVTMEGPAISLRCYDDGQGFVYKHSTVYSNCAYIPQFPTSVDEKTAEKFSIFPNPAQEVLQVNIDNIKNVTYAIIDITGKIVQSNTLNGESIDISRLATGVYSLQLSNKETILGGRKFIKQ